MKDVFVNPDTSHYDDARHLLSQMQAYPLMRVAMTEGPDSSLVWRWDPERGLVYAEPGYHIAWVRGGFETMSPEEFIGSAYDHEWEVLEEATENGELPKTESYRKRRATENGELPESYRP